jgi:hypothetical protein
MQIGLLSIPCAEDSCRARTGLHGLYKFIPNTQVRIRYALLGGFVAALFGTRPPRRMKSQVAWRIQPALFEPGPSTANAHVLTRAGSHFVGAELVFACQNEQTRDGTPCRKRQPVLPRSPLAVKTRRGGSPIDDGQPGCHA